MKAVIMAGGEGSRLRPLTSLRPKPMVPVFGLPVMEHIVGLVKHHGMTEVIATLAFLPRVIEDYFGSGEEWGIEMQYALEETPLGTAGSVKNAEALLDDDSFLIISGDALTDIDLGEVVRFHKERGGAVTIALKRVPDPLEFGVVITREDGRIERFLEKPTWGQVFSDTINTGIYVVERHVLERIPAGRPFDFSSDLFPLLMDEGQELFGCIVDGYWCDIGNLDSYVQAHRDVLDGKAMVFVPGTRTRDDVWVGEGAVVDPGATIEGKVVLGANVKVRDGVRLGPYTVLGDNCVVNAEANLEHTVVWDDTFIGGGASIRGAVLCRGVDIRKRAIVEAGAAVGDEVMIGHDAFVGNDVQIYPFKRIDAAAVVNSSVIWESRVQRSLFVSDCISGLVGVDITPELALMAAQAYGTTLGTGSHVVVSRDSSTAARMIKRAMVAGLNSAGINARDLRVASPAVNRFTTRATRCVGGIHVSLAERDVQTLEIQFYGKDGLEIAPSQQKKVERLYFRREFRRAFLDEIGEIIYPPRALEYYAEGLAEAIGDGKAPRRMRVVADTGHGTASIVLPQVSGEWDVDLVSFNPFPDAERTTATAGRPSDEALSRAAHLVDVFQADLGIQFDASGESVRLITPSGRTLDGDTALHLLTALWCGHETQAHSLAVPLSASEVVDRIAASCGRKVVRTGRNRHALAVAASAEGVGFAGSQCGGYIFPEFLASFDGVMTLGMLLRMLAASGKDLDEIVAGLPPFFLREEQVFCPSDRKGAVMREVSSATAGLETSLKEGVRVRLDDGWALVLPHPAEPIVEVFAEGSDDASAEGNLARFTSMVAEVVGAD